MHEDTNHDYAEKPSRRREVVKKFFHIVTVEDRGPESGDCTTKRNSMPILCAGEVIDIPS